MSPARLLPAIVAMSALAAGCASVEEFAKPPTTEPKLAFARATSDIVATAPDPAWWRSLNDATLDALVAHAMASNRDIQAAEGDLRRARALARLQGWTLLPSSNAYGQYARQRAAASTVQSSGQGPLSTPLDDGDYYALGLEASWEADVFGRLRADAAASKADAGAAVAARRGVQVAIAAELAAQYVGLRGAQARVDAARANAASQRETLRLTEELKAAGRGTRLDVARAREQWASTEAGLTTLESDVVATLNTITVLLGPGGDALIANLATVAPIPAPPSTFGVGTPEDLLRRRPDIVEARRRLEAAAYRAVKLSDWWPRVTLIGGASLSAFSVEDLSSQAAFGFSIGPRIDWPLLDFRRTMLRKAALEAGAEAEYARFDTAVASALTEVESRLFALSAAHRAAEFDRIGAEAAREAADLARLRYREGLESFFSVLDAERRLAEAEDRRAQSAAAAATAYVRLGQSLGAGWPEPEGGAPILQDIAAAPLRGRAR